MTFDAHLIALSGHSALVDVTVDEMMSMRTLQQYYRLFHTEIQVLPPHALTCHVALLADMEYIQKTPNQLLASFRHVDPNPNLRHQFKDKSQKLVSVPGNPILLAIQLSKLLRSLVSSSRGSMASYKEAPPSLLTP